MIKRIDHVGIAVKNLDEAIKVWESLGLNVEEIEEVPEQKVRREQNRAFRGNKRRFANLKVHNQEG